MDAESMRDQLDELFDRKFQRVVIEFDSSEFEFDDLVDRFEDIEKAMGGSLADNESAGTISYTLPDGSTLEIDLAAGRLSLGKEARRRCSELLDEARQYRFWNFRSVHAVAPLGTLEVRERAAGVFEHAIGEHPDRFEDSVIPLPSHEISEVVDAIHHVRVLLNDVGERLRIDQSDRQLLVKRVVVPIHFC